MSGPYETEQQARATVAHIYDAAHASSRRGVLAEESYLMLFRACEAAGIELGSPASYDRRILAWLAGFEPETCGVFAGLIARAHPPAGIPPAPGGTGLTPEHLRTVLDALDLAADCKRDRVDTCSDCDAEPGGALCGTCEWRLTQADEYDALAETLRGLL